MREVGIGMIVCAFGLAILVAVLGGTWYFYKTVQVWGASMSGQAVLAEAEYSRRVRIEDARARQEASELEGQAELKRAQYAARANEALAEGLGGSEAYLRYLYIRMLEETGTSNSQIIYIPTEAGMPVLEAGRATLPEAR